MTEAQVLALINQFIIANNNEEITADVLRPILEAMVEQPNDVTGVLDDLATDDSTNLVAAINEVLQKAETNEGITIHYGTGTPDQTPPATFEITDYYVQESGSTVLGMWQWNGYEWAPIANISSNAVLTIPQILTEAQKKQARINIGANDFYDTAETGFSTALSNFTSLTEKFYFLRISGEGDTVYFASKETNTEDFTGSRIYISATGTKHDLGAPDVTQNGYHFWDIGVLPVTINPNTEEWAFQAWINREKFDLQFVNVLNFEADDAGVNDSSVAIQNALDFAETKGIRRVYVPAGTYLLHSTVYISTEIEFFGDGMDKTIFKIDTNTVLDTIEMFDGSSDRQNFYSPLITTKTTRTGATVNNILFKDFKIADIFYDDTGLNSQVCPMLILNTRNSKIENVEFGNVQTEVEQDGTSIFSLGLSIAFSENILIDKCVHGFAGYEVVSIRFLSKNITTRQNVFNIDKPSNLMPVRHALQVARPSALVSELQSEYGEEMCENYTSEGDVFNLMGGVWHAITAHVSKEIRIKNAKVNALNVETDRFRAFKVFDDASKAIINNNIINISEDDSTVAEGEYLLTAIEIGDNRINHPRESYDFVVSGNIVNAELNRDLSALSERNIFAIIGNIRSKCNNATISNNIVNISGTGNGDRTVFGFYGDNINASGNVVKFDGTVSQNMRAFVVEGGENINVVNNSAIGIHEYSLKVNNVETLENLIVGANNFHEEVLNSQPTKTKTIAYKEDSVSMVLFSQHTQSSKTGTSGENLIQPDYGLPILSIEDTQDSNSFKGELLINIDNQSPETTKVIELFGAEIYNDTNAGSVINAKITFTLDFFNQSGNDIDFKLDWQYVASGEILFGSHSGTIDNTYYNFFELLVTGDATDIFNLNSASLLRIIDSQNRLLNLEKPFFWNDELKLSIINNINEGNKLPKETTLQSINTFIENLKSDGIWAKLDSFVLFSYNDVSVADFALFDYKRGLFYTAHDGMVYNENGYEGDGVGAYIDTNFNPAVDGINYTLNDASRGAMVNKPPSVFNNILGSLDSSGGGAANRIVINNTSAQRINQGTANLPNFVDLASDGFKAIIRDSDTNIRLISQTTEINEIISSSSIESQTQHLFVSSNGFSDMGLGFYFMGGSLTYAETQLLIAHFNNYLSSIGL